jgi:uncharacterized protein (TIGR03083 family)
MRVAAAVNFPSALVDQNSLLAEIVISAAPETPIPTCPGWTMRQLMRHVGRAHRWAAEIIRTKADVSLDPRSVPDGRPPDDTEGARAWLLSGPEVLLDAVTHIGGSDVTVATFDGPRPARWWVRRLLHESTVHRADAVIAAAQRYELTAELAADGIDEWLGRLAERPRRRDHPMEPGEAVTIIPNDVDALWTMMRRGDTLELTRNSRDSLVAVRIDGSATDLFLALMRRRTTEEAGCRVAGDPAVWRTFLERTPNAAPGTR